MQPLELFVPVGGEDLSDEGFHATRREVRVVLSAEVDVIPMCQLDLETYPHLNERNIHIFINIKTFQQSKAN